MLFIKIFQAQQNKYTYKEALNLFQICLPINETKITTQVTTMRINTCMHAKLEKHRYLSQMK
uniref:Uncharacterized protein n=1 Tax=Rhizophora mucronata TaxID=61149 RepID=A0A2P2N953_RHIMU